LTSNRGLKMGYFCYILSPMAGIDRAVIIWREVKPTVRITIFFKFFGTNAYMFPHTLSIMLPISLDMLVFNCTESTDRILTI
jgi:lauroyl/myristoyl acyltransferase